VHDGRDAESHAERDTECDGVSDGKPHIEPDTDSHRNG
jgi:hypothetical protein